MGTFTDNLLKLTDFPFSYSFVGVLVLIAGGKGLLNEEPSLANLGPLLILMGFVATTLSISDPLGRLQKALLIGKEGFVVKSTITGFIVWPKGGLLSRLKNYLTGDINTVFGPDLSVQLGQMPIFGPLLWGLVSPKQIPIHVVMTLLSNFQNYRSKQDTNDLDVVYKRDPLIPTSPFSAAQFVSSESRISNIFSKLEIGDLEKLTAKISSLKRKTLETTWVTREIDKITSMGYFIIVVATFTYAVLFVPNVIDKFLDAFQGTESLQNEQTQDSEDAAVRDGHILTAKIITGAFSFVALGAVLAILIKRARELRSKCLTTFRFLVLQNAIKIKRDTFERRLEEIRQFLVNGDWTLAEVEVDRLMEEYDDLVRKEWVLVAKEKEISPEEIKSKNTEKKIMITWKNGEMSVEEVKEEVEEKVSAEEAKNVEQKKE